jgi:hypothetical protein
MSHAWQRCSVGVQWFALEAWKWRPCPAPGARESPLTGKECALMGREGRPCLIYSFVIVCEERAFGGPVRVLMGSDVWNGDRGVETETLETLGKSGIIIYGKGAETEVTCSGRLGTWGAGRRGWAQASNQLLHVY